MRTGRRASDRLAGSMGYFLFFLAAFLLLTMLLIWPVFPFVVIATLLAYLLYPINLWLRRFIASAAVRAALLTVVVIVAFALPVTFVVQQIIRELSSAIRPERASELLEHARVWLTNHHAEMVANWMFTMLDQGRAYLLSSIPAFFGSVFRVTLGIFVCLFVFYYFTKEGALIWRSFLAALPLPPDLKSEMARNVTEVVRAIFFGQVLTAIVQGILGGIGLVVFDVPEPALLTFLMILLAFFPFIGTPLVWGPAGLLKLMAGDTWQGIGLLIYCAIVVTNIDNFIKPRLIAMHSQVHPVVILIGIIGGTQIFGFIGFLVGPVIFAIFLHLLQFFGDSRTAEAQAVAAESTGSG